MKKRSEAGQSAPTGHATDRGKFVSDFIGQAEAKAVEKTKAQERVERKLEAEDAKIGPGVFPNHDQGETVTITLAEMCFSPKQFNSFRVGPFESTTTVRPGETRVDAGRRLLSQLAVLEREEFERKSRIFVDMLSSIGRTS